MFDKKRGFPKKLLVSTNISKKFQNKEVLKDINLHIEEKEIVSLLGSSGTGKSTILNILSKLEKASSGSFEFNVQRIGYVFQEDQLFPWLNLLENVRLVDLNLSVDLAKDSLKIVGLEDFLDYFPKELSGGMKQRGAIARAIYFSDKLLFFDEALSSLDENLRFDLMKLIIKLKEERGISSLFITHNLDEAIYISDRILILQGSPSTIVDEINLKDNKLSLEKEVEVRRRILSSMYKD